MVGSKTAWSEAEKIDVFDGHFLFIYFYDIKP
jgi:hypothetical protein